jgi:hypothetical protein
MYLSEVTANGGEVHMIGNRLEVWLYNECAIECVTQDGLYIINAVIPTVSSLCMWWVIITEELA